VTSQENMPTWTLNNYQYFYVCVPAHRQASVWGTANRRHNYLYLYWNKKNFLYLSFSQQWISSPPTYGLWRVIIWFTVTKVS